MGPGKQKSKKNIRESLVLQISEKNLKNRESGIDAVRHRTQRELGGSA
jgi:hypothetical protein